MKLIIIVIIYFFVAPVCIAQTTSEDRIYKTYDKLVGQENTDLFNGTEFTDEYLNTDGTYRYLKTFDYSKGSVVYMGEYFVEVLLKYDLLDDKLLTRSNDNLSIFNVQLISEFISEFTIHNRHFVKLKIADKQEFVEEVFKGDFISLYTKHKKKISSKALSSGIQYNFKPVNYYLIEHNGEYVPIETKKDFKREFPGFKTEIESFYDRFRLLQNQNRSEFIKNLIVYINSLYSSSPKVNIP